MELRVALAQMALRVGHPESNAAAARAVAAQAARGGAHLLMLPELWSTGYDLERADLYASTLDQGSFALMSSLAQAHRLHIVGTALEANPAGRPFNTAALFGPAGELISSYRKVHLFPPMGEKERLSPGEALPVFELPWGRAAVAICYDLRFPELWRAYTLACAQLILIPAAWPARRVEHWQLLLRARAVENQLFVVGCNRAGLAADGEFGGHSTVVDPWGRILAEGGTEPGLFLVTISLEEVGHARQMFPFLQDRRPEVYNSLKS